MAIIGREPPADIVVPAPQVSAIHADIRHLERDLYILTDLGSTNGTFVNGQRIQSSTIRLGDRVQLGSFQVDLRAFSSVITSTATGRGSAAPNPSQKPSAVPLPSHTPPPPAAQDSVAPSTIKSQNREVRDGYAQPGMGTELAVALASQKTYGGKAFGVWFLYWLGWIPGAVMNLVYYSEARTTKQITGVAPSGMGCLTFLLITHLIIPAIFIVVLLFTGASLLHSLSRMLHL